MQAQWSSFAEFWASTRVSTWAPDGAALGDERSQLSRHDLGVDDLVIIAFAYRHGLLDPGVT